MAGMLKLATVFSGIGAIEHVLVRMGIDYEIVFACDNGEVDLLTKKIDVNMDAIKSEIDELRATIAMLQESQQVEDLYKQQLIAIFDELVVEYRHIKQVIGQIDLALWDVMPILQEIQRAKALKNNRQKDYLKWSTELNQGSKSTKKNTDRVKGYQ